MIVSKHYLLAAFLFVCSFVYSQEQIRVTWNASTDNVGVAGYNVWIDGAYHGTTVDTFFTFSLEPGQYLIAASAFDAARNESDLSVPLLVDIRDTEDPTTPYDLLELFPNPTTGGFSVRFNDPIYDNTFVQVVSPTGKVIYERALDVADSGHIETFSIDELLEDSMYVIVLQRNEERIGKQFLKVT